jgi:hypothetical protein
LVDFGIADRDLFSRAAFAAFRTFFFAAWVCFLVAMCLLHVSLKHRRPLVATGIQPVQPVNAGSTSSALPASRGAALLGSRSKVAPRR